MSDTVKINGLEVSRRVADEAYRTWPTRPATGFDDRTWNAACNNHVALIAKEMGEKVISVSYEN